MRSTALRRVTTGVLRFCKNLLLPAGAYFLIEVLTAILLKPDTLNGLLFGGAWALLLGAICGILPHLASRIFFCVTYLFALLWSLAQIAYYSVFRRMMWLTDVCYAGEGADYLGDVIRQFPAAWWIGGVLLLALGCLLIWRYPKRQKWVYRVPYLSIAVVAVTALCLLPEMVFLRDNEVWGTHSEYGQSSSYRATYHTMYDARKVYNICGIYQLTARDIWVHNIYPNTNAYQEEMETQKAQLDAYFNAREQDSVNEMTGIFRDKNVVLVLMESMDDWMITQEDTPTIYALFSVPDDGKWV